MTRRHRVTILFADCVIMLAVHSALAVAENATISQKSQGSSVEYIALDAPAGLSRAVVVQGYSLAYTRQLLPLDREGKLRGNGSVDKQIEQVLNNLDAVLESSGSSLGQLVRVNIYSLAPSTTDRVREQLSKRLDSSVRPTLTEVLTPLPHRDALVAVDAVAVASELDNRVTLRHCEALGHDPDFADAAVLPRGGVAYLSGVPGESGLTESAVDTSMKALWKMLGDLKLSASQIVQLKVFLRPASSADEVLRNLKAYFPNQITPPVIFVEWLAPPPVEIELISQLPVSDQPTPNVEYYNPSDVSRMQIFSRAALVRTERQIYVSGLFARKAGGGQDQALDVFDQLQGILAKTGSDLRHLAKATYYVSDESSARGMDRARLWLYDQDRPPAASKCMVHGVGQPNRTLTMDMIAVSAEH